MPNVPVPCERELDEHFCADVEGVECDVYVYREKNQTCWGLLEWEGRHVRVEVPYVYQDYDLDHYCHDARGRHLAYYFTGVASFSSHVMDALLGARDWIRDARNRTGVTLC